MTPQILTTPASTGPEPEQRPACGALLTRLVAVASAAALATAAAVVLTTGTASASMAANANASATATANMSTPACKGWSCHGHNPVTHGCAVSSTVTAEAGSKGTQVATLWNRYCYGCNANWGRAQLTSAGLKAHDSIIVLIYTTDSHGDFEEMCYPGPDNTGQLVEACSGYSYGGSLAAYTDMVDGTNVTTAEVGVYNSSGTRIALASAKQ